MLEEALKVFGLGSVCSLNDLDIIYKKLVRKNYEDNFPYNKEVGAMNVRLYEWSYQIILPFAIGKELNILNSNYLDLATLKILIVLQKLGLDTKEAKKLYNFDKVLGYKESFFDWCVEELIKKDLIPLSDVNKGLLEEYYNYLRENNSPKLELKKS